MKLRNFLLLGTLSSLVLLSACDKDDDEDDVNTQDRTFAAQASMSNNAEIQTGNLALTKSTDAGVRKYAQMMVTEHTAAQADLRNVATNVNISIADTIGAANTMLLQRMGGLSGRAFDTVYINSQRVSHQMTSANFQAEISNGSHQQVKSHATNKLPSIQTHLAMADTIYLRIR